MGMTLAEKILSAHSGGKPVHAGEFVSAKVDLVLASELSGVVAIEAFDKIKDARIFDPQKVVFVMDHFTPNKDIKSAEIVKKCREFGFQTGIRLYDVGRAGIQHVLLPEQGLVSPGDIVAGADSHTCTYGALGALGTGIGSTDAAAAMALGELWFKVPETIKIVYHGRPQLGVVGKDIILHTIKTLGVAGARYMSIEFSGDSLPYLQMSDRLSMANMAIEAGAMTGIFPTDEITMAFIEKVGARPGVAHRADPDAVYVRTVEIDISTLEPQVAVPFLPENSKPVSEVAGLEIHQAAIGMCTNGTLEDMRLAAAVFRGRKVHPRVRAIIIPGTQQVYRQAIAEGLIDIFLDADCAVSTSTCGPCLGGHMGVLAAGERCVATSNRNFRGRMGHMKSEVYLAGPAVAAASAVAGCIASPADLAPVEMPLETVAKA